MKRSSKPNHKGRVSRAQKGNRPIRTEAPPHHLAQIIAKSKEYTASLRHRLYPHPETGEHDLSILGIPDLTADQVSLVHIGKAHHAKKSGGGHGKSAAASPQVVHQEVSAALAGLSLVNYQGNLVVGEFNAEFGNASKATLFAAAYAELVKRHHLIFFEEIDHGFLQTLGSANGYGWRVSTANTRNQAVGFLVHPRLDIINMEEWVEVGNVQGVPDLRPAFALELKDKTTGFVFWAVVVHLKSMRGGPVVTAPVRYQQCALLAKRIAGRTNVLLGGDWNTFLNNTQDTLPLTQAGAKLVFPGDTASTQSMGGRLDGFFAYQLKVKVGRYQVRNFWRNRKLGRTLSDHGLLTVRTFQLVACTPGSNDPDCQPGGPDLGGDNQNTDVVTS